MKNFKEFAISLYPDIMKKYEIYTMYKPDLVGKKVISIRSGFSAGAGQIMTVSEVDDKRIILIPNELSKNVNNAHLGWMSEISECHNDFIIYEENIK